MWPQEYTQIFVLRFVLQGLPLIGSSSNNINVFTISNLKIAVQFTLKSKKQLRTCLNITLKSHIKRLIKSIAKSLAKNRSSPTSSPTRGATGPKYLALHQGSAGLEGQGRQQVLASFLKRGKFIAGTSKIKSTRNQDLFYPWKFHQKSPFKAHSITIQSPLPSGNLT